MVLARAVRHRYGRRMGVGASLAMEKVPARLRGVLSGLLEGYATGYLLAPHATSFFRVGVGGRCSLSADCRGCQRYSKGIQSERIGSLEENKA